MKKLSILLLLVFFLGNMVTAADPTFLQPLLSSARISYYFNTQPKPFSNGIFWSVPIGTQVVAAADGTVVKSGWIAGLGSIIVIMHSDNHTTVYGHLSKIIANPDSVVKQGDVIGLSGDSGNALEPGLYFEVQKGDISQDPSGYLNLGSSHMPNEASANTKHYPNQPLGWSDWIWGTQLSDFGDYLNFFVSFPESGPLVDVFMRRDETNAYLQMNWDATSYCFVDDLFAGITLLDDYAESATPTDQVLSMQYGNV